MRWVNDEYERKLLAAVMLNADVWNNVQEEFDPKVFAVEEYRLIAKTIRELSIKDGKVPGVTTLSRHLRKQGITSKALEALAQEFFVPSEAPELLGMLHEMAKKRHTLQVLEGAVKEVSSSEAPAEEIAQTAQNALIGLLNDTHKKVSDWSDVLQRLMERQSKAQTGQLEEAIPLGLPILDGVIGGLVKSRQLVIGARSSMGKSALMMNMVRSVVSRGHRALIITPEQTDEEFAHRLLSCHSDIPASLIGRKLDPSMMDKFNDSLTDVYNLPIRFEDSPRPTVDYIKAVCRAEKARYPDLELICIDYLGEIKLEGARGQNTAWAVGEACSELRGLAKELNVAQIVVNQLNRGLEQRENKRPMMSDLRESGRIEEVADTILFLYRHGYYEPGFLGCDYGDWIVELQVGKARQSSGVGERVLAFFNRAYLRFQPVDPKIGAKYNEHFEKLQKRGG